MKYITYYQADDGSKFETEEECKTYEEEHEKRYKAIRDKVVAYDDAGQKLDMLDENWFYKANTIVLTTEDAARALAYVLEDGNEEYYDIYNPDFANAILKDINNYEFKPLVYGYIGENFVSADGWTSNMDSGWYNVNRLYKYFSQAIYCVNTYVLKH